MAVQQDLRAGVGGTVALQATLLRPLFSSAGDGNGRKPFSVWAVVAAAGEEVRATADIPAEAWGSEGDEVVLSGGWADHPRYGRQFAADSVRPALPRDARGLARWLARQPGVGPATAGKVVSALGAGALERVLEDPACLEPLDLARPQREAVAAAARAFRDNACREGVLVFCHQHGLGPSQADAVWRALGAEAPAELAADPWQLAFLGGFGFYTADMVARSMGVDPAAPGRLRAVLHHTLHAATWEEGHVYLPERELLARGLAALREIAEKPPHYGRGRGAECRDGLGPALRDLAAREAVVVSGDGAGARAYLPRLHLAERAVGGWLARRHGSPGLADPSEAAALAGEVARLLGTVDAVQERAVASALSAGVSVLTGGPGTGKTFTVRAAVRAYGLLRERGGGEFRAALAAPTGRAAKRLAEVVGLEAKTLHRLLGYNPGIGEFGAGSVGADLLVVDECSMVDLPLMAELLARVPDSCSVLLVGDADQLPPVGPGAPFHEAVRKGLLPVTRLERIYRQGAGSAIAANAQAVNSGRGPAPAPGDAGYGQKVYPRPRARSEAGREAAGRQVREAMARDVVRAVKRLLADGWAPSDVQVLVPTKRGPIGAKELNERLRDVLNPGGRDRGCFRTPGGREIWLGDRVMHLANDYAKNVFNGEVGTVAAVNVPVSVPERGPSGGSRCRAGVGFVVRYETGEGPVEVPYDGQDAGDVALAYASTVHKAQGCEFPVVVLAVGWDSYMLLKRNLLYTALSRARDRLVVLAEEGALERAAATEDDSVRYQDLAGAAAGPAPGR